MKKPFFAQTLIPNFVRQAGFTMIELLVVIAVIGVLAVAVLSSIDPIEQINKGRDTRLRSNAAQLLNAGDRFYAIQEQYSWNLGIAGYLPSEAFPGGGGGTEPCGTVTTLGGTAFCQVGGAGFAIASNDWLQQLATVSEVKQSFIDQLSGSSETNVLYISKLDDEDVYICFRPSSKQFQLEAVKGCTDRQATLPDGACPQSVTYTVTTPWDEELICLP